MAMASVFIRGIQKWAEGSINGEGKDLNWTGEFLHYNPVQNPFNAPDMILLTQGTSEGETLFLYAQIRVLDANKPQRIHRTNSNWQPIEPTPNNLEEAKAEMVSRFS